MWHEGRSSGDRLALAILKSYRKRLLHSTRMKMDCVVEASIWATAISFATAVFHC